MRESLAQATNHELQQSNPETIGPSNGAFLLAAGSGAVARTAGVPAKGTAAHLLYGRRRLPRGGHTVRSRAVIPERAGAVFHQGRCGNEHEWQSQGYEWHLDEIMNGF